MPIQLYDSMARRVLPFEPRDPGKAGIYCCGMTVYNYAHIGNMRTIVCFDLIRRYLTYRGFDVTFVMNYTDVDDKIIERARIEGVTPDEITA
ncbi:MAG: class I tRNA ligase family protein, partial [Actinomycetota bacterium]|nr:class I tRNA ligase family protein [Actinomycetota bacterium]